MSLLETIIREGIIIPVGTHEGKTLVLASDHRGYAMKQALADYLSTLKFVMIDVGTCSSVRCDYPDYAAMLGDIVSENYLTHVGVAICGSGNGVGIVVGKFPNIYATRCRNSHPDAVFARKHNNSNVLLLGAHGLCEQAAKGILHTWLYTPFYEGQQDEAYLTRYVKIVKIEQKIYSSS